MADTITIFCKNNNLYKEVPIGSTLREIYTLVGEPLDYPPMNAQVNNKTESLNYRCWQPQDIAYVDYTQLSGMRTYVRSLCHILSKAVNDLWPTAILHLEHPVSRGYYCIIHGEQPIDEATIAQLKTRMRELVDADFPFVPHRRQKLCDFLRNGDWKTKPSSLNQPAWSIPPIMSWMATSTSSMVV